MEKSARGRREGDDLHPRSVALIVVDMQNDFVSPRGKMAQFGFDTSSVQAILPAVSRLLSGARRAGVTIAHTRMVNELSQNALSWYAFWGEPAVTLPGTWGAEHVEGLEPGVGEAVIEKFGYGAFFGTNLDTLLRRAGTRTVVVCGTGPGICAGETLQQAFALGYHVVAVSDALASFSRRGSDHNAVLTETALYTVEQHYGRLMTADEVVERWTEVDRS